MTNAIGTIGTSDLTGIVAVLWRRDGQVADFVNNNWKEFASDAGTDIIAANEYGTTGIYGFTVPAVFRVDWWFATFHQTNKSGVAMATCINPSSLSAAARSSLTSEDVAGWWPVWLSDDATDPGILQKTAGDLRVFGFDFGNLQEIVAGQTIASVTLTSTGSVTLTNTTYSTYAVFAEFDGGTVGDQTVTATVVLSGGSEIVRTGTLRIVA